MPLSKSNKPIHIVTEGVITEILKGNSVIIPSLDSCTGITVFINDGRKVCAHTMHVLAVPFDKQKDALEILNDVIRLIKEKKVTSIAIQTPDEPTEYANQDFSQVLTSQELCDRIAETARSSNIPIDITYYSHSTYVHIKSDNTIELYNKADSEKIEKELFGDTIFNIVKRLQEDNKFAPGDLLELKPIETSPSPSHSTVVKLLKKSLNWLSRKETKEPTLTPKLK